MTAELISNPIKHLCQRPETIRPTNEIVRIVEDYLRISFAFQAAKAVSRIPYKVYPTTEEIADKLQRAKLIPEDFILYEAIKEPERQKRQRIKDLIDFLESCGSISKKIAEKADIESLTNGKFLELFRQSGIKADGDEHPLYGKGIINHFIDTPKLKGAYLEVGIDKKYLEAEVFNPRFVRMNATPTAYGASFW